MNSVCPAKLEIEADGERHVLQPTEADRHTAISSLLRHAGLPLNTRCGGRGVCDGCRVDMVRGRVIHLHTGTYVSPDDNHPHSLRACEHSIDSTETLLRIPPRSSLRHHPQIVSDYQTCIPAAHDPLYAEMEIPAQADPIAQILALHPGSPVEVTDEAPKALCDNPLVAFAVEHGPKHRTATRIRAKTPVILGAAIDIGTTTVAVMLVDLKTGKPIARASKFNEQIHLGDDVVTRINLCMVDNTMLGQLQRAIARQTLLPLLQQAVSEAGHSLREITCLTMAGNTTMLHLLAGVDPSPMGVSPFTPAFLGHEVCSALSLFGDSGLRPNARCHLLPGAAAYIGSDLTAGIVATGLLYEIGPSLLIDIGTNGEIILKHGNRLMGCATAAGPAFEGNRLSCGMRAVEGAISHIEIAAGKVAIETIGGTSDPVGICGSAYVDFLAGANAAGVLGDTGRFDTAAAGPLADHLMPWADGHDVAFRVAYGPGRQPIVISQRDIASLLQAKAAIAAGTFTLLDRFSLKPSDIETVFLAGGFGTHLNRPAAIACGLLRGFAPEQIRAVGNTSLAGAYLALMDSSLTNEIARAATAMEVIELNLDPSFEARFIDELALSS